MSAVSELVAELTRRGIELRAHGDRLRYRPRSAMTAGLAQRVQAHKSALLALLRQDYPSEAALDGQDGPVSGRVPRAGGIGQPDAPEQPGAADVPHELSLAERVETGYVNPGWTAQAWADRLCQLAERCEGLRPKLAAQCRTWAANVRKNEKGLV
jgi:hypothetical protein